MGRRQYQWVATTPEGFVRHLVSYYLRFGYRFYVTGSIKPTRSVDEFDEIMEGKFRYRMSRSWRNRRKNARGADGNVLGLANVHYLRYGRFWILVCTKGKHWFYEEHVKRDRHGQVIATYFRDAERDPIFFAGYSIRIAEGGYLPRWKWLNPRTPEADTKWHVRVRIAEETFRDIKADFIARARSGRFSAAQLEAAVWNLPFLPYAPIREQLRGLVRWMNRARKEQGFHDLLEAKRCIPRKIPPVKAFEPRLPPEIPLAVLEDGQSAAVRPPNYLLPAA